MEQARTLSPLSRPPRDAAPKGTKGPLGRLDFECFEESADPPTFFSKAHPPHPPETGGLLPLRWRARVARSTAHF